MLRSLPLILLAALLLGASPAPAAALTATKDDPAERPEDPGRDIASISTTYEDGGAWRVAVRFHGSPTTATSALMRLYLGERAADGACEAQYPNVALSVWTDPEDRGARMSFEDGDSVNVAKQVEADGAGFILELADERLGGRAVCGLGRTTLSRSNESFDSVPAFEFPGAPAAPAPGQPGQHGAPAQPGEDAAPSAQMTILRDRRALRRGIVKVSVRAASEKLVARATLYGPGRRVLSRHGEDLVPGQEVRLSLRLGKSALARLRRTGRLPVEVVTLLVDDAGNQARLRGKATLRSSR